MLVLKRKDAVTYLVVNTPLAILKNDSKFTGEQRTTWEIVNNKKFRDEEGYLLFEESTLEAARQRAELHIQQCLEAG